MTGIEAFLEVLHRSGVRHIFGLPGDTGMALYDALRDARGSIEHIMTRDERSASFMAIHLAPGLQHSMPDWRVKCAAHRRFFHGLLGFVDERGGLEGLVRPLLGQARRREPAQLVVDERQ